MSRTCRNCTRVITDPGTGGPAAFCMYCGARLGTTAPFGPDETVTRTADHPAAGQDSADVLTRPLLLDSNGDPDPVSPPRPPARVGGYQLVRCLGVGGMGAVYEAVAADGATRVAVKLLSGRLADNPVSVERFKQEGRVASQITHPRCVFVIDADADAGRPYIVMELMPGTTLKDLVDRRGPLPPPEAVARILDVIDGLAEAHRLGVIHRDVKPSNCFLTGDDRVKVGDFGLSKSLAAEREAGQLTQSGAFLGTVLFASPEQIRGEPVGYESDVYSVCATLYYLLTGRAPHQHTSLTGALAKAISEPPPPTRALRPGVPASLDRVVLRGLDRNPARRWPSAADLRDALRDLIPAAHTPARRRALALAYAADMLLLQFVVTPLDLLTEADGGGPFAASWVSLAVAVGYFGPAEGVFGTTVGKQLLRLRVAKVGEAAPPGPRLGLARAAVFHALLFGGLTGLGVALDWDFALGWRAAGTVAATLLLGGLVVQLRRTPAGYRGLHDRLAGCHTLQRPRPPERVRLVSRFPNPLDAAGRSGLKLPRAVGGFAVVGHVCDLPDGGEVWVGADESIGRRVLVRVCAPGQSVSDWVDHLAARPARLRLVGQGELEWRGEAREWLGYVAPSGAPLADVIDPDRPLGWADARPLVEQLVDELIAGDGDGTGLDRPTIGQVWVEPGGRLQLLDVPLPVAGSAPAKSVIPAAGGNDRLSFVREVASLVLEGAPRSGEGRLHAPLPPHAAGVTDRLFSAPPNGYTDLTQLRADLTETHAHPPKVTRPMRAAHLGVQAAMLAAGLLVMFLASGLYSWVLAMIASGQVWAWEAARAAVADPARRAEVLAEARRLPEEDPLRRRLEAALAPGEVPRTLARLDQQPGPLRANLAAHRQRLTIPERALLDRFSQIMTNDMVVRPPEVLLRTVGGILAADPAPPPAPLPRWELFWLGSTFVVGVPAVWAAFAFAFRGGLALALGGITLVRADGRPAGRFRCAARELVVWFPLVALLLIGLWVQAAFPGPVSFRFALWLAAVSLLPVYVLVALLTPSRPPQDRIVGTVLVPV